MAMELRHLRYFVAVAEERNFTRAAAKLGIGQPPLSLQIKDLEAELDVRLFRRVPHGAELTSAGECFLEEVRGILSDVRRACSSAQRAARGESGRLRVGFTGSAAFYPAVSATVRAYGCAFPGVHLSLEESNTKRLMEGFRDGTLDAAFLRPGPEDLQHLHVRAIAAEKMLAVLPDGLPLGGGTSVRLSDLADLPFVLYPRVMGPALYDAITDACRACGFEPRMGQVAPQMSSMVTLVAAGAGVSIVPASLSQIAVAGVRFAAIRGLAPVAHLSLGWRRDVRSATLDNFTRLASEHALA